MNNRWKFHQSFFFSAKKYKCECGWIQRFGKVNCKYARDYRCLQLKVAKKYLVLMGEQDSAEVGFGEEIGIFDAENWDETTWYCNHHGLLTNLTEGDLRWHCCSHSYVKQVHCLQSLQRRRTTKFYCSDCQLTNAISANSRYHPPKWNTMIILSLFAKINLLN